MLHLVAAALAFSSGPDKGGCFSPGQHKCVCHIDKADCNTGDMYWRETCDDKMPLHYGMVYHDKTCLDTE